MKSIPFGGGVGAGGTGWALRTSFRHVARASSRVSHHAIAPSGMDYTRAFSWFACGVVAMLLFTHYMFTFQGPHRNWAQFVMLVGTLLLLRFLLLLSRHGDAARHEADRPPGL